MGEPNMAKSNGAIEREWANVDPGIRDTVAAEFVSHMKRLGHTDLTVTGYCDGVRHFCEWLRCSGIAIDAVDDNVVDRFARHRCKWSRGRSHNRLSLKYVRRVQRFVRFLTDRGLTKVKVSKVTIAVDAHLIKFQSWLRDHRGISERTIERHSQMITGLLPSLGSDPRMYDAKLVQHAILEAAQRNSRPQIKTITTALRGYLRFLSAQGACRPGLDRAIPVIPQWRLSALPKYLPSADVERLIASCDLTKPHGIRDRAILLLLARLGLRAGDVFDLRLKDVAWEDGTLRVSGKARQAVRLPLPQDAGDALLQYLERVRPRVDDERIFLRSSAPYRAFSGSRAISDVVRLAVKRAGITNPPSRGAHLLRHSAATGMLRAGATLEAIGALLRHRSADTTAYYAKVDVAMLRRIAQPWPGAVSC
jgi:integrase/recombinase XerD